MHTSPSATTDPAPFIPTVAPTTHLSTGADRIGQFRREPQTVARLLVAVAFDNGAAIILFDPIPPQSEPVEGDVIEGDYWEVVQ